MGTTHRAKCRLEAFRSSPQARLRLFCVPYAGGSSATFRPWADLLPPAIDLWAAELPGHGTQMKEPPFTHLEPLVRALLDALHPYLDLPLALFGHSMGALLAFELTRELRRNRLPEPVHLFVSGHRAPQLPQLESPAYTLSDTDLLEHIRKFEGTPEEVLQHTELMQIFLPTLRADFAVCETYVYADEGPFNAALSAFGGGQDRKVSQEQLEAWRMQTLGRFRLRTFPGGHFYLNHMRPALAQAITYDLQPLLG